MLPKIYKSVKKRQVNFDRLSEWKPFSLFDKNLRFSRQAWNETLVWTTSTPGAIANTGTETILFPNITIPANYLADGRCLRLRAFGSYGTFSSTTGFTMALRWGGVAGTVLAKSGVNVLTVSFGGGASMTALWSLEAIIQVRSNGATGSLMTNGEANFYSATLVTGGTLANYGMPVPLVSGSTGGSTPVAVTVDLTADTALSLTGLWATGNAANSIQGLQYTLEALN